MEWALFVVLSAPVLGVLWVRRLPCDRERRTRVLHGYAWLVALVHVLAVPALVLDHRIGLWVLAVLDLALLAAAWAALEDERALERVIAEGDPRACALWLEELGTRKGASALRVDHAIAIARALADRGDHGAADAALESIPRCALASREAARLDLAIAEAALGRGDTARARAFAARAIGRAPPGARQIATARAMKALLDAIEGRLRRAIVGLSRMDRSPCDALERALVALARAHVLAARGELGASRAVLEQLDREARARAESLARACPGPASALATGLDAQGAYR